MSGASIAEKIPEALTAHFKTLDVEITLFPEKRTKKFRSLNVFYDFVLKEYNYWFNFTQGGRIVHIRNHYINMKSYLDQAFTAQKDHQANNLLNQALNLAKTNKFPGIHSTTETAKIIKRLYDISPARGEGFTSYLYKIGNEQQINSSGIHDPEYLTGLLYAFSYSNPEVANTLTDSEREAREAAIVSLSDSVNQIVLELSEEADEVRKTSEMERNTIVSIKEKYEQDNDSLINESKQKIKELEELYTEKLRLSAPAEYWSKTRKGYWITGGLWIAASLVATFVFLFVVNNLIIDLQATTSATNNTFTFDTIKYGILLTVFISIGVFIINFFIKLATSAFHLSRDANERMQLTHLYLALINENAITTEERTIVLQALFSRADTGLLKGDSSPTIPDSGLLGQLLKSNSK